MQITITMDDQDFDRLTTESSAWRKDFRRQHVVQGRDVSWHRQCEDGRFEHAQKPFDTLPSGKWEMAYWMPYDWSVVLLVRSYLEANGEGYEIIFDMGGSYPAEVDDQGRVTRPGNPGEYVILTNYQSPVRGKPIEK